ncbi:MAG: heavy metal sensor histidine kinase [Candidatus Omnitrophica bacterium]|nr:heavy metal sensor histidine kinase [Candidatus Omnitrophota bacterium]MBU1996740.1 heavy metal sensor histidine kinase [Candidatus Omnitrophota bacterium]MBU4334464.1 heavy metal sensor histidine kinase [Candidatus Omnitrophota bacterium]
MFLKKTSNKGKWFKSIGWKLTVWNTSLILFFVISFSVYLYHRLESQLYEEVDIFLKDELNEFNQFVMENLDKLPLIQEQIKKESSAIRKHYQMYYGLLDPDGQIILQSSEFQPSLKEIQTKNKTSLKETDVTEYELGDDENIYKVRIVTYPVKRGDNLVYYVQVGMNLARIEKTLANSRQNIIYALPGILILSLTGGYFLTRRNLKPISQMVQTTNRITISNLNERLPIRGSGDELDELAKTFNKMIDRIEQAYQKLSQFSADAAHELRTPLTTLIGEIEVALTHKRSSDEYYTLLTSNLEELTRLMRLVNNLLLLCQDEKPDRTKENELINLNEIVRDITELFNPVAEDSNISLKSSTLPEPIFIFGDKWRIEQLISNLLDNAIRYNLSGGSVDISLTKNDGNAELVFSDTGIGISESDQSKIFDRFYRVDSSRNRSSGGSGLGLNIVKSVVQSYFGEISVKSQPEKGSTFTIKLPLKEQSSVIPAVILA